MTEISLDHVGPTGIVVFVSLTETGAVRSLTKIPAGAAKAHVGHFPSHIPLLPVEAEKLPPDGAGFRVDDGIVSRDVARLTERARAGAAAQLADRAAAHAARLSPDAAAREMLRYVWLLEEATAARAAILGETPRPMPQARGYPILETYRLEAIAAGAESTLGLVAAAGRFLAEDRAHREAFARARRFTAEGAAKLAAAASPEAVAAVLADPTLQTP